MEAESDRSSLPQLQAGPRISVHPDVSGEQRAFRARGASMAFQEGDCPICLGTLPEVIGNLASVSSLPTDHGPVTISTDCGHRFCSPCLLKFLAGNPATPASQKGSTLSTHCPLCRHPVSFILPSGMGVPQMLSAWFARRASTIAAAVPDAQIRSHSSPPGVSSSTLAPYRTTVSPSLRGRSVNSSYVRELAARRTPDRSASQLPQATAPIGAAEGSAPTDSASPVSPTGVGGDDAQSVRLPAVSRSPAEPSARGRAAQPRYLSTGDDEALTPAHRSPSGLEVSVDGRSVTFRRRFPRDRSTPPLYLPPSSPPRSSVVVFKYSQPFLGPPRLPPPTSLVG